MSPDPEDCEEPTTPKPLTAREECYQQIRACMKEGLERYYRAYPHLLLDDRSSLAIEHSVHGLHCMLNILDTYDITRKDPPVTHPSRRAGDHP